jgi:hypothetical protein
VIRVAILLLAIFFVVATCILVSVGTALVHPGTPLDLIWRLKADREAIMMQYRMVLGPFFLAFAIPMGLASYGFFMRRPWARGLAIAIFTANGVGDLVRLAMGHLVEVGIGVTVAVALIVFLMRPRVKSAFG